LTDQQTLLTNRDLRQLVDLKRAKDNAKRLYEEAERAHKELQAKIWSQMETNGDKTLTKDLGPGYGVIQFGHRQTVYARVLDKDSLKAALVDMDREEIIKDDFEKRRLNEMVRDYLERGEELPPGLDIYTTDYVAISIK
jgi:hypothetical protein